MTTIKADHIRQLRTALEEARTALGLSTGGYEHPTLTENFSLIYAVDFQELRGQVLSAWQSGGGVDIHWLVADHLGTPRMIFDQTGSLANISRHDYLPFGEELYSGTGGRTTGQGYPLGPNSIDGARQKFTQKERDIETGLDYFLARYYSSSQGRFTSVDPENHQAFLDTSQPQSWNAYSYVNNNPLAYIDPDGMGAWTKLKNLFLYGYAVENDQIERMAQERREWLNQHYYERDQQGNWRPYDASNLSTRDVWDKYREVKFLYENGELQELTPQEIFDAWNGAPMLGPTKGPSGRESTRVFLNRNWDKATFGNTRKSIEYHLKQHVTRHGRKMSEVQYTQRALKAFGDSAAKRTQVTDNLGRDAVRVVSKEGTGLFTPQGKIIWFQPKF